MINVKFHVKASKLPVATSLVSLGRLNFYFLCVVQVRKTRYNSFTG